jgi:UDP-glucose:tetrahydrobiopterin glucosyltransferase
MSARSLRVLFVSTSVGPLGSGLGGGVELTLVNLAQALTARGHRVWTIAPAGSRLLDLDLEILQVLGVLQATAQNQGRSAGIEMPGESVLAAMWQRAWQLQGEADVIVNFAYDWLPFYLTPFFTTPVVHLVSMGSLTEAMDGAIESVAAQFPDHVGVHSRAQAETFAFAKDCWVLGNGLDLDLYEFQPEVSPMAGLGWVGRIAPEKGLEDAVAAAQSAGMSLRVWGVMQCPDYWQAVRSRYPEAQVDYGGFLTTPDLQRALGQCRGLVMTPKWVEAFGNVAIEALACGVPVVAYGRGGPREIVVDGECGWLVEPDDGPGLVAAISKLGAIERSACRLRAEQHYSLEAMGERVETWLRACL